MAATKNASVIFWCGNTRMKTERENKKLKYCDEKEYEKIIDSRKITEEQK